MTEIKFKDEADLQRKILAILNKKENGFNFEIVPHDFDLIDTVHKIYIEVKPENFAPAQILYALAKREKKDIKYIGLACAFEARFYKSPSLMSILSFAKEIDPLLSQSPSSVNQKKYEEKAFELLGDHFAMYPYDGKLDLSNPVQYIFVDQENYEYFKKLFEKYDIDSAKFLPFIADIYAKNQEIDINNNGWIFNKNTFQPFWNTDEQKKQIEFAGDFKYKPIKDFRDKSLFKSIRIRENDIQSILHQIDRLEPITNRRVRGRFFTSDKINEEISDICRSINPEFIIEPYVGSGSLIASIVNDYPGHGNDYNKGFIDVLKKKYEGSNWIFSCVNTVIIPLEKLIEDWKIPKDKNVLILTNPPFGTSSTNILASRKGELKKEKKSRNIEIDYGGLDKEYGRGDLCIPAIAKLIEIVKYIGQGYIATFSPAGVLCGRNRYNKLLKALLRDFKFMEGHIFSGENFNSVASKKAIAFTVWQYQKGVNTNIESLVFNCGEKEIRAKKCVLLKDGWKYDTRKLVKGEIAVQGNDRFNVAVPKMFHLNIKKGGSELIQENIKIELNVPNIPSILIYGLWSTVVGYLSITTFPVYINEAYTYLPDMTQEEVQQILVYAVIYNLIVELKNNYTQGKIGFIGMQRQFKFGDDPDLTKGCLYLIETYGHCIIDKEKNYTIKSVFEWLKSEPDILKIDEKIRNMIKKKIEGLLDKIGYWDYLPIPMKI